MFLPKIELCKVNLSCPVLEVRFQSLSHEFNIAIENKSKLSKMIDPIMEYLLFTAIVEVDLFL